MLLLEQNINKKQQINKKVKNTTKFNKGNDGNSKYKVRVILNSTVYAKESDGHLLRLYNLIAWKNNFKKNI